MAQRTKQASRWPGHPRPRIPETAEERVTRQYADGSKEASEFWLRGELVGRATWEEDGAVIYAAGERRGVREGYQLEYHPNGVVSYAEPFVNGLVHGLAMQFNGRGRLLLVSPFKHGTGIDFFCDMRGNLAEEHPILAGRISGNDRWWASSKQIYEETQFFEGHRHGIYRHWKDGVLDIDCPKYFIRDEQVSRRRYLAAMKLDPTLPPYRPEDDAPERAPCARFLELRRRTLRRTSLRAR